MPRPKKVSDSVDELAEKITVTLEVTKSKAGNSKKRDEKSTGKKTLMEITVPKGKGPKDKKIVKTKEAKEVMEFVKNLQSTFLGDGRYKESTTTQKRSCCCEDTSSDSGSSCSCVDCADCSCTSTVSDSSSGCSSRSLSESSSDNQKNH